MSYLFQEKTKDELLNQILRQVEDNFATSKDVDEKQFKTTKIDKQEPRLKDLKDGDECAYFDGTDYFLYRRIGGVLIKFTGTKVT